MTFEQAQQIIGLLSSIHWWVIACGVLIMLEILFGGRGK